MTNRALRNLEFNGINFTNTVGNLEFNGRNPVAPQPTKRVLNPGQPRVVKVSSPFRDESGRLLRVFYFSDGRKVIQELPKDRSTLLP